METVLVAFLICALTVVGANLLYLAWDELTG